MSLTTPTAGGLPQECNLLSLIPPDDKIAYADLVARIRQDYPRVSESDIRDALYSILPDIHWDIDYSIGAGIEAYVLWHSHKSRSLLDLQMSGTDNYPAIRRDAILIDDVEEDPQPETPQGGPRTYYKDRWIPPTPDGSSPSAEWMIVGSAARSLGLLKQETEDKPCRCGHVKRVARCPDGHVTKVDHMWCGDYLCPTCYGARLMRTKGDIVDRLVGAWGAYQEAGLDLGPIKDMVLSPPQDVGLRALSSTKRMRKLYNDAYKMLDKIGMTGASVLFHPWRVAAWAQKQFKKALKSGEYEGGIYGYLRSKNWLSPKVGALRWSPHFHVVGYGPVGDIDRGGWMKSDEFYEQTGWIYKTMVDGGARPIIWQPLPGMCLNQDTLDAKIYYILTHLGILWDREDEKRSLLNVRWHGLLSSQKLKVSRHKYRVTATCSECHQYLHEIAAYDVSYDRENRVWTPVDDTGYDTGEEFEVVVIESTFTALYQGRTGVQQVTRIVGEGIADLDPEDDPGGVGPPGGG